MRDKTYLRGFRSGHAKNQPGTSGIVNRIATALIRLHGCAGWSAPLLFANPEDRVPGVGGHISFEALLCSNKRQKPKNNYICSSTSDFGFL